MERLSAQDALFVYAESDECPMHVGAVALLEAGPLRDAAGRLDMPRIVEHFESRLRLAPSFRRRLMPVPLGLGHPVWVDDASFDITAHVKQKVLSKPVTLPALYQFVEQLQSTPLPRDKPLWDLWLVDGLEGDRVAVVQRLHHALSDGVSAVQFATLLYDLARKPPPPARALPYTPAALPSAWQLTKQALAHHGRAQRSAGAEALAQLRRGELAQALGRKRLRALSAMAARAPRSPLTVSEPHHARRWLPVNAKLAPLMGLSRSTGATLNDVVLALVTAAVARFCAERGGRPSELHTWMPMSTRRTGASAAGGNRWSGVPVTLPSTEGDLLSRVRAVRARTREVKSSNIALELKELSELTEAIPAFAQRLFARTRFGCGARNLHLSVSNVPGPPVVLYVLGARVLEVHPFSIVAYHSALAVTTLSYDGFISFGLSAQAHALPNLDRLAALLREEIDSALALAPPEPHKPQVLSAT